MYTVQIALILTFSWVASAAFDLGWDDDSDLTSFVTRPEIKAPRFNVTIYDLDAVSPGFWFIGPYAYINQDPMVPRYYQACQTGPHIYDRWGDLVWSGACLWENQNACDFRPWRINGTDYLSTILYRYRNDSVGRGVILDNTYQVVADVLPPPSIPNFNMHEFGLVDNGTRAVHWLNRPENIDVSDVPEANAARGWIHNMGIREVDLATNLTTFEWWAHPEISVLESSAPPWDIHGPYPRSWNWLHGNSIAKNADGDYLLSARFTDAIYKISSNGTLLWRLGGRNSSFTLDGFKFSRQHDAQWLSYNDKVEVISFLNNGADTETPSAQTTNVSSAVIVQLDKTKMTAHVIRAWHRPDGQLTRLRGNVQHLPNGNLFAVWSENSYLTELSWEGHVIMEAQFSSKRFVTYRAYKSDFTGYPSEPPIIKTFVYGTEEESSTTVSYVSWNGATQIDHWKFYRHDGTLLGTAPRRGFEVRFQSRGYEPEVYAEAVDVGGNVLGRTESSKVPRPRDWRESTLAKSISYDQDLKEQQAVVATKTEL